MVQKKADFLLKKYFLLLPMLKTSYIFVQKILHIFDE